MLHKAKDYRVKVLHVLAADGNGEASGLLNEPARAYKAERCRECTGCKLMAREKTCGECNGCKGGRGCEEHHRRCREWPRNANTFHAGSVVTSVSSQFDLLAADLSKYEAALEALRELDLEMEEDVDQLGPGSASRDNPRFSQAGRERELDDEQNHLARLAVMLQRHGELADRLREVTEEEDEPQIVEETDAAMEAGELTGTQTSRQLIQMFGRDDTAAPGIGARPEVQIEDAGELSTVEEASVSPGMLSGGGWSIHDEEYVDRHTISPSILQTVFTQVRTPTPVYSAASTTGSASAAPTVTAAVPRLPGPTTLQSRFTLPALPPRLAVPRPSGVRVPGIRPAAKDRRRSQSTEGLPRVSASETTKTRMEDRKFELMAWMQTRKNLVAARLISIEETINQAGGPGKLSPRWINEELQFVLRTLEDAEKSEMEVWKLVARLESSSARHLRAQEWGSWFHQIMGKVGTIRGSMATPNTTPEVVPTTVASTCQRRGGFLERVKLPQFTGSVEDYGEFKCQFRELCSGESYTSVIELAQLRQKLPRDAVALLVGLVSPEAAWARLDETYGNVDLQVIAALKRLRSFKPSKSAVQGQVVELAIAVQRCLTVLRALDREQDFLVDRETLAEVIDGLPVDAQQRWYHRRGVRGESQLEKASSFLLWLEEERADAVAIHLDSLARRQRQPASHTPAPKVAAGGGATDQSVFVATSAVQPGPGKSATPAPDDPTTALTQGGGVAAKPKPPARVEVTTAAQAQEVAAKRKANLEGKQLDKCPICKSQHEYEKEWKTTTPPIKVKMLSTLLTSCPRFLAQPPEQKSVTVTAHAACPTCTSWDHVKHKFGGRELPDPKCKVDVSGSECGGRHGRWFHASSGNTGNVVSIPESAGTLATPGLFEVYTAQFVAQDGSRVAGTIMVDSGSDTDYVRHDFARELGLTGEPHVCRIKVVDMDYRTVHTAKYGLTVEDIDGEQHAVAAQGLGSITTLPPDPDLTPLLPLLGDVPSQVFDRPQGRVDVLIGLRNSKLHGKDVREWGNLRLLRSRFGCGWAVRGTHELLKYPSQSVAPSYSMELHAVRNSSLEVPVDSRVFHVVTSHGPAAEFHELAELGTTPKPACERCSGCTECTFRRKKLSLEDQAVVSRVEASLQVDEVSGIMSGVYPWKPCVSRMRSNLRQAEKVQASIERHMVIAGTHADFVEEVKKSIVDGRVRKISEDEIARWHGPVHYVTIFAVVKMESVSTKTRVVSNSAMKNAVSRLSLNDCLWPGPNALADLLDCLIFWRSVEVAIIMDLKKAYQAIHTSPMELHLRRFVFRSSPDLAWETYGYTRANFGDLSAGLMLEVGKRRVANLGAHIDPQAADQLRTRSYVDDSILGGSSADVSRMRGERTEAGYSGTVAKILAKGAMSIKFMAVTGSDDLHEEEQLGGKCLGVGYRIAQDLLHFRLDPCFYEGKARSTDQAREVVKLGPRDVAALQAGRRKFTRRQALSMVMALYDPLGLVGPALVSGKLLLRRLYSPSQVSSWDADLPGVEKQKWASWFAALLSSKEATFPRTTRPPQATGQPRLVGFCDSSEVAVCASLYVVWTTEDGGATVRILMAKCRVAPLLGMTVPRGEMQSLTILTRLMVVAAEAFPARFASVSAYTDSMCSIGALSKTSTALKPYFGNRVSEIQHLRSQLAELTDDLAPVHHIPGSNNPADVGTRSGVLVEDLGEGSVWQRGPTFLGLPYADWPITTDEARFTARVPSEEVRAGHRDAENLGTALATSQAADLGMVQVLFHSIDKCDALGDSVVRLAQAVLTREKLEVSVRALARVLRAVVGGDRNLCSRPPTRRFVELSVQLLLRASSASSMEALREGRLSSLGAVSRGGVVWVQGRVRREELARLLGTSELPVIMASEALAKAIMSKAHRCDHRRSPQDIAARSRRMVWVPGATRLAKTVAVRCYLCRSRDKKMARQQMGGLPDERTNLLAPFEALALDLFGPYRVKDAAKGRRVFKCWVVAFVCLATKAACLLACPGYSTAVFLDVFHMFTGIYGKPRLVYTDHAPSLVKAGETHDWGDIAAVIGETGTEWRLTAKGCSWRNGLAERLIRSARHTLSHELERGALLDFHQFSATLSLVSSILNSRPLSVRTTPDGDFLAISPRDVLLGRASRSQQSLEKGLDDLRNFEDDQNLDRVEDAQAKIIAEWRRKWLAQVFPDLVPRTKWKQSVRNIKVGDIGVLKYDKSLGSDSWRLAKVVRVDPDADGHVRTINVQFRPRHVRDRGEKYRVKQPLDMDIGVQRFAVMLPIEEQGSEARQGDGTGPAEVEAVPQ